MRRPSAPAGRRRTSASPTGRASGSGWTCSGRGRARTGRPPCSSMAAIGSRWTGASSAIARAGCWRGAWRSRCPPTTSALPCRWHSITEQLRAAAALVSPALRPAAAGDGAFRRWPRECDADGDRLGGARPAGGAGGGRAADLRRLRIGAAAGDQHQRGAAAGCGGGARRSPLPCCRRPPGWRCMRWWAGPRATSSSARPATSPRHWGGSWEALPGANHFTVLAPLGEPDSPLVRRAARLAGEAGRA